MKKVLDISLMIIHSLSTKKKKSYLKAEAALIIAELSVFSNRNVFFQRDVANKCNVTVIET